MIWRPRRRPRKRRKGRLLQMTAGIADPSVDVAVQYELPQLLTRWATSCRGLRGEAFLHVSRPVVGSREPCRGHACAAAMVAAGTCLVAGATAGRSSPLRSRICTWERRTCSHGSSNPVPAAIEADAPGPTAKIAGE